MVVLILTVCFEFSAQTSAQTVEESRVKAAYLYNFAKANGRPVEARRPRSPDEFKSCHVLFIGFSDKERIAQLLNRLQRSSVLTVGQSDQFIRLGGMINLALKNTTIELEIDPAASNAVGLKISSRLLVVARLVKAPDQGGGER
jgi:YfiR/HmsC-like